MIPANRREFHVQLVNTRTKKTIDDDAGKFQVYTAGAAARARIYDISNTELTQEVVGTSFISRTMVNGKLHFLTDIAVSAVDVSILTAGGRSYFLKGLTESQQRVDVDPDKQEYVLVAAFNDKASCTTIRPLGFQMRRGMVIHDVRLKVTAIFAGAAAASNHYNVGRSTVPLGFLRSVNMSSVGFKAGELVASSTGTIAAAQVRGTDLRSLKTGNATNWGFFVKKFYLAATAVASNNLVVRRTTAETLTHSFTNTGVSGAGKAYIYYSYTLLPTESTQANP